ncbi:MAG: beta-ketoacyl-ACP synthase II [Steroidobacteraceae bacterium]|nr:beta-ketoacyl-ACP synthase II [Pseudomonadota bacterium]MBP6105485.1 beta-ketoacyl-ACP synthase II [Steroidobacteraceae bacterium]MBP7013558.1 beta-ketoacyl-ACP synthase II [Steroidobacteraceae bacterium]
MSRRRVVVTGLGIVSPLGSTVATAWEGIVNGRSGIGHIDKMDLSAFPVRIGGQAQDFNAEEYMAPKDLRKFDPFVPFGVASATQAIKDSGFEVNEHTCGRVGVAMGAGIGGLSTIEENTAKWLEAKTPRKISPFFIPGSIINAAAGQVSIQYGLRGPNLALVTACTTSTHSIGLACRLIQYGDADIMVAGGSEMAFTPLGVGSFCQARALSLRNDEPARASRPWDKDRDGFVMAEGGGAVVLEEYEHAKARGAQIYAEFVGFGMSGDAHHITSPPEDGEGARLAMTAAIRDAQINVEAVDYINAHATSTELGDRAETIAIKRALGEHARKVAVSSTKSMTGHLLGAAGVVEAIFSILAIRDRVLPPTINLENPDPECDLDYVPGTARQAPVRIALSNSFGFGGTNGSLIFRALS